MLSMFAVVPVGVAAQPTVPETLGCTKVKGAVTGRVGMTDFGVPLRPYYDRRDG